MKSSFIEDSHCMSTKGIYKQKQKETQNNIKLNFEKYIKGRIVSEITIQLHLTEAQNKKIFK